MLCSISAANGGGGGVEGGIYHSTAAMHKHPQHNFLEHFVTAAPEAREQRLLGFCFGRRTSVNIIKGFVNCLQEGHQSASLFHKGK